MGLYNKKMPELIRKIQQEQRWHAKPIGPLGMLWEGMDAAAAANGNSITVIHV